MDSTAQPVTYRVIARDAWDNVQHQEDFPATMENAKQKAENRRKLIACVFGDCTVEVKELRAA